MKVKQEVFAPLANNCYLIVDEESNKSALVDCSEWTDRMEELIGDTELEYILLTHGHFDHIGGVSAVKKKYGAKVAISNEDAPMLSNSVLSMAAFQYAEQESVQPDIIVKEGDVIELGSVKIRVISTPGHTKGGVCYIAEDCLFTGDTLFRCSCGRTDFMGGSEKEMLESLRRLKALDGDYKIYAGHEGNSTLDFERRNNPYMNL